jgi:hypothetical protein
MRIITLIGKSYRDTVTFNSYQEQNYNEFTATQPQQLSVWRWFQH